MQGTIVKVAVEDGATVEAGDLIVVLEAMKMEQPISAHKAGTVTGLSAEVGAGVTSGEVICTIADAETEYAARYGTATSRFGPLGPARSAATSVGRPWKSWVMAPSTARSAVVGWHPRPPAAAPSEIHASLIDRTNCVCAGASATSRPSHPRTPGSTRDSPTTLGGRRVAERTALRTAERPAVPDRTEHGHRRRPRAHVHRAPLEQLVAPAARNAARRIRQGMTQPGRAAQRDPVAQGAGSPNHPCTRPRRPVDRAALERLVAPGTPATSAAAESPTDPTPTAEHPPVPDRADGHRRRQRTHVHRAPLEQLVAAAARSPHAISDRG